MGVVIAILQGRPVIILGVYGLWVTLFKSCKVMSIYLIVEAKEHTLGQA